MRACMFMWVPVKVHVWADTLILSSTQEAILGKIKPPVIVIHHLGS